MLEGSAQIDADVDAKRTIALMLVGSREHPKLTKSGDGG